MSKMDESVTGGAGPSTDSPPTSSTRHLPALDGVRALAILCVLAFHLHLGWLPGGYLGVDLFFVLSGFLITTLLLDEWRGSARISLGGFWGRRARRLLPALFLVLAAVALYAVVDGRFSSPGSGGAVIDLGRLRGDALATLLYVANWHIAYFNQQPSPLQHTWSLSIEEQFYFFWPLVIVAVCRWGRGNWRRIGLSLCVAGAVASALDMAILYHSSASYYRVYCGTDTRAFTLLVGAALAILVSGRPQPGRRARTLLHIAAPAAAAGLAAFWLTAGPFSTGMYRGGFLACAVLAAVVIADARQFEQGLLARLFSFRPLRWIGQISYGLYLWHEPIFQYLNEARTGLSGAALDAARLGATFAVSALSYYLVERPIRRLRHAGPTRRALAPAAAFVTVAVVLLGTTPSVADPVRAWPGGGLDPGGSPSVRGAGGFGAEVPIALPPAAALSRAHPLRVLTIGDSLMTGAELGIGAALESTGDVAVLEDAQPTWGLTSPGARSSLARAIELFRPQLVIGTWSSDNEAAAAHPNAYRDTVDAAVRTMLRPGSGVLGVVFLQMPEFGPTPSTVTSSVGAVRWKQTRDGVDAWNRSVQQSAQAFPGKVMYLPVAASVETGGRFTAWMSPSVGGSTPLRRWVRVRMSDGVRLCPPGITRFSAPVLQDLSEIFRLPAAKTHWWQSHAVAVQAFEDQDSTLAMTCPDDHPAR